jgi:hypothetical protein
LEQDGFSRVPPCLVDRLANHFSGFGTSKLCEDVMQRLQGLAKSQNSNSKMSVPRTWLEASKTDVFETFQSKGVEPVGTNYNRRLLPAILPATLFQHRTTEKTRLPFDDVTRH